MKIIVVGAGSFGSWSALKLQNAGHQVTLVDSWGAGNSRASSGGETRVIRTVYGQDDIYIEMARDAIEQWDHLQKQVGESLLEITGSLWLCGSDDSYVQAAAKKMEQLDLELKQLAISAAASRFPQVNFSGLQKVYWEPLSGFLRARQACAAVASELVKRGGKVILGRVQPPPLDRPCHQIQLGNGQFLAADQIVFASGPWLKQLFPNWLDIQIQVSRQEVYYFGTPAGCPDFDVTNLPIWLELNHPIYYGIPSVDQRGFKIARDERGVEIDPECTDRMPTEQLVEEAREYLGQRFPQLARSPLVETRVCQYSNTPDGNFLLDRHPASGLIIVGGGSGHGFKMGPVMGEKVLELVRDNRFVPQFQLKRLNALSNATTQFQHAGIVTNP